MKNIPTRIYLQLGLEDNIDICEDFNELSGISWCVDKIYSDDLAFISVSFLRKKIEEQIKIKEDFKNNKMCSKAEYKAICKNIDPIINVLKNLIKA